MASVRSGGAHWGVLRLVTALSAAALAAAMLSAPPGGATVGASVDSRGEARSERGAPGSWTKVSSGTGSITFASSLYRTADGMLHVVYPRSVGAAGQLGHTAVRPSGSTASQSTILPSPWTNVETSPIVMAGPSGGLRVVFGGVQGPPGFWSNGRMYTLTAPASGATWTLPMEAVGNSGAAFASHGTGGTTLADGTPVAAFPLNASIIWHTGTGTDPDQSFNVASCCAYDMAMVRSGNQVWVGWYANGSSAATNGTFVRQIAPTLGPILRAPGSSVGTSSVPTERVALAARAGGGVYVAYCSGPPNCSGVRLWRVGASSARPVPGSRYAARIALSAAQGGRLWLAWSNNIPRVKAVRTNPAATRFGALRDVGVPRGRNAVHALALEGSRGRGDVVINVGDAFWHTQVVAGLTLTASPARWPRTQRRTVTFTVTDAGVRVAGALVRAGSGACRTTARGTCRITFPPRSRAARLTARATKSGYAAGVRALRVTSG